MSLTIIMALIATSAVMSGGAGGSTSSTTALCDHKVAEVHVLVRADPPITRRGKESLGWMGVEPHPVNINSVPAALLPPIALSGDVNGWIATHSRHERWQIDAWQYYLTTPLSLTDDTQINVRYRIPIRMIRPDRRPD